MNEVLIKVDLPNVLERADLGNGSCFVEGKSEGSAR
jgi:hypothetical protein